MHGPSWSGRSGTAVGGPGSPLSDSVFRSNTSRIPTRQKSQNRLDGVGALFTYTRHYRRDPARQVPPLGVGDPLPQVSRDTCSGTASIWPLRGYTRHWDGKRGDDAAFRSDISAWMCHNCLANLVGCLLDAVQAAPSIGIRAPFERARPTPKAKSVDVMGARRLHTTTSSIGTYEEELDGGLAAPRPTCRSYDSRKTA